MPDEKKDIVIQPHSSVIGVNGKFKPKPPAPDKVTDKQEVPNGQERT